MNIASEQQLVPYQVSSIPAPGPWLVLAPHADDESFGMGGSLLLAKEQQIETHVVVMTDGRLGLPEYETKEAIAIRRAEAKQAGELLGLKSLSFLDFEDRQLAINDESLEALKNVIITTQAACIFVPSFMEFHPDHRMTFLLLMAGLSTWEYDAQIYAYEISVQGPINHLVDISSVKHKKLALMKSYASQLDHNNYIEVVSALDRARTYTLNAEVQAAEGFLHLNPICKSWEQSTIQMTLLKLIQAYFPGDENSIAKLEQEILTLSKERAQILNSTSWKISAPIRWIKSTFFS